jgi:class 3 adenylate cyclase
MTTRRLAAIVAADVAGYSRLMHADEEATHARLTGLMAGVIEPAVTGDGGRIVKHTGDGFLAEFGSAVEAGCDAHCGFRPTLLPKSRPRPRIDGSNFASACISGT